MARWPRRQLSHAQIGAIAVVVCMLGAFVALAWTQERAIRERELGNLGAELNAAAQAATNTLEREIDVMRQDLRLLAATPSMAQWLSADDAARDEVRRALDALFIALLVHRPDYDQVRLIDARGAGHELLRAERDGGKVRMAPAERLQDKGGRDYVVAARRLRTGQIHTSALTLNQEFGRVEQPHKPTLRMSMPLSQVGGADVILVLNRDMTRALGAVAGPALARESGPPSYRSQAFLVNAEGDFLVHPDMARTFGFDLGRRFRWADEFRSAAPGASAVPTTATALQTHAGPDGLLHMAIGRVRIDRDRPDQDLHLAYAVPDAGIAALVADVLRRLWLIDGVVLLATLGVGWLVTDRMMRPVRRLTLAARHAAAGHYAQARDVLDQARDRRAGVELRAMRLAFRRMLGTVRARESRIVRLNAALESSETESRRLFEAAPDGLLLVGADGAILRANRSAERLFGHGDALVGMRVEALIPPDLRTGHAALRAGYAVRPEPRQMGMGRDLRALRADGTEFPIEVSLAPVDLGGRPGVIMGAVDITDRKQAEHEVLQLNALLEQRVQERTSELRAANLELEAFSYAVAHDLRAPLRAMVGFATVLKEDNAAQFQGTAAQFLDQIVEGGRRMSDLIDGLLTLSRATQGPLARSAVDVSAIAHRVGAELARAEPQRQVSLDIDDEVVVRGDPRMMEVVVYNLLGNAWKYTAKSPHPRVQLRHGTHEHVGGFCVADNGAGFDMRHTERLFAPFQRLHRRDEFPGIGIGLATVQRIVRRHGGHIQAWGAVGEGARFCLTFGNPESVTQVGDLE